MFTQKLFKTGNSVTVTIPKQILDNLHIKEGEEVVVKQKGNEVILTLGNKHLASDVDAKFMKMVEEFANEHEDVLRELAKR